MKIQKISLFACALFTSVHVVASPPAMNTAPAIGPGSVQSAAPMSLSSAPMAAQPGAHEEAFLEAASEEKRKEEFLSEVVQDEQKIAQMAKEFDVRLKKIEDAFSGICNHGTGGSISMPSGSSSKSPGGMPVNAPVSPSPASSSGGINPGAFNPPAPTTPK